MRLQKSEREYLRRKSMIQKNRKTMNALDQQFAQTVRGNLMNNNLIEDLTANE